MNKWNAGVLVLLIWLVSGCQQAGMSAEAENSDTVLSAAPLELSVPKPEKSSRSPEEEMIFMQKIFAMYEIDTKIWGSPDLHSMEINYDGITVQIPIKNPAEDKVKPYLGTFQITIFNREGNTINGEISSPPADRPEWEGRAVRLEMLSVQYARLTIDDTTAISFTAKEAKPVHEILGLWRETGSGEEWQIRQSFADSLIVQNQSGQPFILALTKWEDTTFAGIIYNPLYGTGVRNMGKEITAERVNSSTLLVRLPDQQTVTMKKVDR